MADWATISSLATAGGTLVLAVATFASVRSANRAARISELALQEQLRPVIVHSNREDPAQEIVFVGGHWVRAPGGGAVVEHVDDSLYLVLSVRNVGAGIGVLQGWHPWTELTFSRHEHVPVERFRTLSRDLYVPAGGVGLWQGRLRESDEEFAAIVDACRERRPFTLDLLYSDHMGGQRTVSRFSFIPSDDEGWLGSVGRHWSLDRPGPRR